jgi:hypothetical protein
VNKFYKFLTFIKIMDDHDESLSLTSIALWVVLVKLALVQSASIVDIGALLVSLASYQGKKMIPLKVQESSADIQALTTSMSQVTTKLTELESKASGLAVAVGLKNLSR